MSRTVRRITCITVALLCLVLGLTTGPAHASAPAKPAAVTASVDAARSVVTGADTREATRPKPGTAQAISYHWGPAAYASFKTSSGTTVATLTIGWEIADNGVCRWINRVRWAPSSFLVQTVIVGERWHTTPPQTTDMERGWGWHQDNGSTNGYTSVPLGTTNMPCLDKTRLADIHWSIYRTAGIATWAGYLHSF